MSAGWVAPSRMGPVFGPLRATLVGSTLAVLIAFVLVATSQLSIAWAVLVVLAVIAAAGIVWSHDVRDVLLVAFLVTLPIDISKAITSQATTYAPTLSVFLSDVAFLPLLATWALDRLVGAPAAGVTLIHQLAFALLAWLTISSIVSISPVGWALLIDVVKYTAYLVVIGDLTCNPRRLRVALLALGIGAGLQLTMIVLQVVTGSDLELPGSKNTDLGRLLIFEQGGGLHLRRPSGLLPHPNVFAVYLDFLLPPIIALGFAGRSALRAAFVPAMVILGGGLVALLLGLSRGGWISFGGAFLFIIVAGGVYGFIRQRHLAIIGLTALLGASAVAVAFPAAIYRVTLSDQRSSEARIAMMDQALLIIRRNPIMGVGIAGYNDAAQTNIPSSYSGLSQKFRDTLLSGVVHNKYLLTFAETGIVGLLLFVAFLLALVAAPFKATLRRAPEHWLLLLGLSASVFAQMIFYNLDNFSYDVRIGLLYAFGGLIVGVRAQILSFIREDLASERARTVAASQPCA